MVEIGSSTTAGDIIKMIEAEGTFKEYSGSGGWMVFEVAQDFGMGKFFFFFPLFLQSLFQLFSFFFLLERPIRSFELVADVQSSWNKDKMVNYLVLRKTSLEIPLNLSVCFSICFAILFYFLFVERFYLKAIPSSSPTHSGYVEWEAKRGKWNKRFMQLREHSIWISKRDTVSIESSPPPPPSKFLCISPY